MIRQILASRLQCLLPLGHRGAVLLSLLVVWSVIWKGMALWKAARLGSKAWYVALLVINTAGLLEILYIYFFSKRNRPALSK